MTLLTFAHRHYHKFSFRHAILIPLDMYIFSYLGTRGLFVIYWIFSEVYIEINKIASVYLTSKRDECNKDVGQGYVQGIVLPNKPPSLFTFFAVIKINCYNYLVMPTLLLQI